MSEKKLTEKGWIVGTSIAPKDVLEDIEALGRVSKRLAELYKDNRIKSDHFEGASIAIESAFAERDQAKALVTEIKKEIKEAFAARDEVKARLAGVQEELMVARNTIQSLEGEIKDLYDNQEVFKLAGGGE